VPVTTFVLVHGAWHGGWAWDRVAPMLRDAGARVVAPTLTGLPPRADELSPEVGLRTHVDDVVAALDGDDVVLVGHSYGALVARQAADARREHVRHVVLVDGWAGPAGSSLVSLAPPIVRDGFRAAADGWLIPAPPAAAFGIVDGADTEWLEARLGAHPLRTFEEPTELSGAVDAIPGTAICCQPSLLPFDGLAAAIDYAVVRLEGPHDVMVSEPRRLAEALLRTVMAST
jgi:pimeloyl-ACP methyl ester carboxylesterase